jgi:hypothetical protein
MIFCSVKFKNERGNHMERLSTDKLYSEVDLTKAYINGLECAVVVLEKAFDLNYFRQQVIIKSLKNVIRKHKLRAVRSQLLMGK